MGHDFRKCQLVNEGCLNMNAKNINKYQGI